MNHMSDNGMEMYEHPAKSPDINPIEHVWSVLHQKAFEERDKIHTKEDLFKVIEHTFYHDELVLETI